MIWVSVQVFVLLLFAKCDQYILTIRGQDLNGGNDNLPTLEKEQYEVSIEENTHGVEVMRLKAVDLDLKDTDNWEAVFDIVRGNEAGYFSIRTDPNTNEGILMLDKPVNYEEVKNFELGLIMRSKAPPFSETFGSGARGVHEGSATGPSFGGSSWQWGDINKIYSVKISVKNQREGPRINPKTKAILISEDGTSFSVTDAIVSYSAIDGDTGELAENVRYTKDSDSDNWLTIDPETAGIKLNKIPDTESPHLVNGMYIAKILCITEETPAKTVTGTIAIQMEDFNDHCPILTTDIQTMCATEDEVIVIADDEDAYPNGTPFEFEIIPEGTEGKWQVEHLNDTAAILRAQEYMWPGIYRVKLVVKDQQGHACPEPQKQWVQVSTCENAVVCGKQGGNSQPIRRVQLGPAGIGILVRGTLLVLLLVPLLLISCQCRRATRNVSTTNTGMLRNPLAAAPESIPPAAAAETLSLRAKTGEEVEQLMLA